MTAVPPDRLRQVALALSAVLVALGVTWLTPAPASACSCVSQSPEQQAAAAQVIFAGTVTGRQSTDPTAPPRTVTFAVSRVYKGAARATEVVATEASTASCGLSITGAGPYVIYAQQRGETLTAGLCDGSRSGSAPAGLGPGAPPQPDPLPPTAVPTAKQGGPPPGSGMWVPRVGLVLAAGAAVLIGVALLRPRPR